MANSPSAESSQRIHNGRKPYFTAKAASKPTSSAPAISSGQCTPRYTRDYATLMATIKPPTPTSRVGANRHMLISGAVSEVMCLLGKDEVALCAKKLVPNCISNGRGTCQPLRIR